MISGAGVAAGPGSLSPLEQATRCVAPGMHPKRNCPNDWFGFPGAKVTARGSSCVAS